jgi:hypothetical protein
VYRYLGARTHVEIYLWNPLKILPTNKETINLHSYSRFFSVTIFDIKCELQRFERENPYDITLLLALTTNGMTKKHGRPLHFLKPASARERNYVMLLGFVTYLRG